jgi:xylulose-5-phosphate/fructose-6-phosphate phosphoketolase
VRGYKEEGTTTTPFDMTVLNDIDRFHLAQDVIERCGLQATAGNVLDICLEKLREHSAYIREHGEDMPEIRDWRWVPRGSASQ